MLRKSLSVLLSTSLIVSAAGASGAESMTNQNKDLMARVLDQAENNSDLANWIREQYVNNVRHGLDFQISQAIDSDATAQKALFQIRQEIATSMDDSRIQNMATMARAMTGQDGQFQEVHNIVIEAAKGLHFSEKAIKDAHVFVSGSGDINAYTYSPSAKYIDVVVFDGLLQLFTENGQLNVQDMRAVLTHEIGHIAAQHVMKSLVLQSVFKATGEMLIPNDQKLAFRAMWMDHAKSMLRSAIGLEGTEQEGLVSSLTSVAERTAQGLMTSISRKDLVNLSQKFMLATGVKTRAVSDNGDNGGLDDVLKAKEFKAAMVRVTRSQEITADRLALVQTGPEGLADAMAKLAGGRGANGKAIIRQADELLARMSPQELEQRSLETNDHPGTVFRAAAFKTFMSSMNYRLVKDPFERSIYFYMVLTQQLAAGERSLNESNGDLSGLQRLNMQRQLYTSFANQLSQAISDTVVAEMAQSTATGREPELFNRMIKMIDRMRDAGGRYAELATQSELGRTDRVFAKIYARLKGMKNPIADQAARMIGTRTSIPYDYAEGNDIHSLLATVRAQHPMVKCDGLYLQD